MTPLAPPLVARQLLASVLIFSVPMTFFSLWESQQTVVQKHVIFAQVFAQPPAANGDSAGSPGTGGPGGSDNKQVYWLGATMLLFPLAALLLAYSFDRAAMQTKLAWVAFASALQFYAAQGLLLWSIFH